MGDLNALIKLKFESLCDCRGFFSNIFAHMEDKVKYMIDKLKSLQRYDLESSIFGDTLCKHREGDYVEWDDIEYLINEIEKR